MHPLLRVLCALTEGELSRARAAANIDPTFDQNLLANCLAYMGNPGVVEALRLPGLSVEAEMKLALELGELERSLACLKALVVGCTDRNILNKLPAWKNRAILGAKSSEMLQDNIRHKKKSNVIDIADLVAANIAELDLGGTMNSEP